MRHLGRLLAFVLAGVLAARLLHLDPASLTHSAGYRTGAFLLLAVGLYGAACGIDLRQARGDARTIVLAVTVGVLCKALLIGAVSALVWRSPLLLVLGVAVAQIDPLSVASIMADGRMSVRARTMLASWSSFDDPVTVLLSIYVAAAGVTLLGLGGGGPGGGWRPLLGYAVDLAGNGALVLVAWIAWRWVRRAPAWTGYLALAVFVAVSIWFGWMLAVAVLGLFARPAGLPAVVARATRWALHAAAVALGLLLAGGVGVVAAGQGVTLGLAAFAAQALVAVPLTRGMPGLDRWHLAAAQQNGITAIILALTLQVHFDGAVAVIAPAIVTANLLHALANTLIDRNLGRIAAPAPGPADG